MSHQLDLAGVVEKLVLLEHLAHGSKGYCRYRLARSEPDDDVVSEYWGWVKGVASAYTLECSIRLRVLLDTVSESADADKQIGLDSAARVGLVLGERLEGDFEPTVREACNKIIHARKVALAWNIAGKGRQKFRYWSGDLELAGRKDGRAWKLRLHTVAWAQAMQRFLYEADALELTVYVGQDWY